MSRTLPIESVNPLVNLMIRDVATVRRGVRPGEIDRDMSQRYLTLTANVEGEDMGRASGQVQQAIDAAGEPPRGVRVETMGQLPPMNEMFQSLVDRAGRRRVRDLRALDRLFPVAAAGADLGRRGAGGARGHRDHPLLHEHVLNIESFMGSIMCLGVSVSNSVMLVTFIDEHWKKGMVAVEASILGASERLRPILMTACAMTVGMVPMALALERGSQMQAPAGPGGDRWAGDVHVRDPAGRPVDLRGRDRQEGGRLAVDLPGRSRELALRPERLRRPWPIRPRGDSAAPSGKPAPRADEIAFDPRAGHSTGAVPGEPQESP